MPLICSAVFLAVDHLRRALTQRAVMIDFRVAEVGKGLGFEMQHGSFGRDRAVAHVLKQL